jgi:hypothetical protein
MQRVLNIGQTASHAWLEHIHLLLAPRSAQAAWLDTPQRMFDLWLGIVQWMQ